MSQLRSVLDEVAAIGDHELTLEELASDIAELVHVGQMVEVLVARKTKHLSDRDGHRALGYSSPTNLLVDVGRITPWRARQVVSRANAAVKAPVAYQAWVDARLSTDQARWLLAAAEAMPDVYPDAEERLVEIVEGLDAVDTRRAVEYWRQAVDGPGDLDAGIQGARRGLYATWLVNGMLKVDGTLTPTAGTETSALQDNDATTP